MSAGGITEFLSELHETDALAALRQAHAQKSALVFKIDGQTHFVKARIESFSDKRAILFVDGDLKMLGAGEVSMKFNVGTEIYFVKAPIKSHLNRYYFDMDAKVIQLKRRKEPRFTIPAKWNHIARLVTVEGDVPCRIIDISLSGIRLEIQGLSEPYHRDDIIKIKFQVHKRAEVQTAAIVRFALNRPGFHQIVGLEFAADISNVQKERVAHIIDDIKAVTVANLK